MVHCYLFVNEFSEFRLVTATSFRVINYEQLEHSEESLGHYGEFSGGQAFETTGRIGQPHG